MWNPFNQGVENFPRYNNEQLILGADAHTLLLPISYSARTDSARVSRARRNNWRKKDKKPALNPELWDELLSLIDKHEVKIEWIKGHAGHPENERCDKMAVAYYNNLP